MEEFVLTAVYFLFSGLNAPMINRENNFSKFVDWLHSNGIDTSVVDIKHFPGCGYGLQATKDLQVSRY